MAVGVAAAGLSRADRSEGTLAPVIVALLALVTYLACVAVAASHVHSGIDAADYVWFAGWLICALCGGAVARSPKGRRYGWFLLGVGVCAEFAGVLGLVLHLAAGRGWPTGMLVSLSLLKSVIEVPPQTLLLTLGALSFPNGRVWPGSRRWRWFGRATVAATLVLMVVSLIAPGRLDDTRLTNPLGITALKPVLPGVEYAAFIMLVGCLAGGVTALIVRFRRGDPAEHRAVAVVACAASWVLLSVAVEIVLSALHLSVPDVLGAVIEAVTIAALPVAALTSGVRRAMFDVDRVLNRNLTYLACTAIVVAGYALAVALLGRVFEHRFEFGISLVVTGLIAVLFGPLKIAVQRGVEIALLGRRATPYRALTSLGRRLDASVSAEDALSEAVRSVAETFRVPHVVLSVDLDDEPVVVAEHGDDATLSLAYPLVHRGVRRGTLHLAPRSAFERLTATDERLLSDFSAQIAGAVEAVQLTEQLRHSRTAVVMANEEERRRIRRELHDGIGPVLASTALAVQRIERQLDADDPRRAALRESRSEVQHAIDDIRQIVAGLRPAVLDELGLAAAIEQRAAALSGDVTFDVEIAATTPALPAAVEVVVYRVATEAMTNVVKHASATACTVHVTVDGPDLRLQVRDNGCGLRPTGAGGLGLRSMQERTQELGGRLVITTDTIGTEVEAWVPLT